jgi:hypothetical protein
MMAVPGYVGKYLGWPLVVGAALGGLRLARSRRRDPLTLLLAASVAACIMFLVIGVLSPLDLRYYLAVAPTLDVLAAFQLDAWCDRGKWGRGAAVALGACAVAVGVSYWLDWFSPVLPR